MNILPEDQRLAEVSSNIWGTKFKIVGANLAFVPRHLGQINYKASLLHLQPRQMRLEIMDLKEESNEIDEQDNDDLTSWLEDDQRSEDSERQSSSRQESRAGSQAAMFMSDDEEDNDKGNEMEKDPSSGVTIFLLL